MYDRYNLQTRLRPGLHPQIKERADEAGISVNEWINRAIEYTLTTEAPDMTITEIRRVTL